MTEAGEAEAIGLGPEHPLADAVALGALAYGLEQSLTAPGPDVSPDTGQSVVVDNSTGDILHVGGPGFKYWDDLYPFA